MCTVNFKHTCTHLHAYHVLVWTCQYYLHINRCTLNFKHICHHHTRVHHHRHKYAHNKLQTQSGGTHTHTYTHSSQAHNLLTYLITDTKMHTTNFEHNQARTHIHTFIASTQPSNVPHHRHKDAHNN